MLKRHGLTAVLFVAVLGVTAFGQDAKPVTFKWKFEKGKPFYQTMTTTTEQLMKVMGSDVKQTQKQTFYFSWTPEEEKDGNWIIKQKIEGVKMDIDIGGSKISYDSTAAQPASNPLSDFFKALVGSEFKLTLNPKDMKVTKIEGREKFIENLVKANPQMKQLLEQILSEKALLEMADPTFAAIPTEPKKKGDSWTRETSLDMGPIGTYKNSYRYTYEGPDAKLEKIKVETTLTYQPPGDMGAPSGLPFKIKSADLKSTNAGGTIFFDPEKGRVEKSDMKIDLKGDLSIEIGGQTTRVELTQTQTTNVETSDTNPAAPKTKQ